MGPWKRFPWVRRTEECTFKCQTNCLRIWFQSCFDRYKKAFLFFNSLLIFWTENDEIYTWGRNNFGKPACYIKWTIDGDLIIISATNNLYSKQKIWDPQQIRLLIDDDIGQLGNGTTKSMLVPTKISSPWGDSNHWNNDNINNHEFSTKIYCGPTQGCITRNGNYEISY